VHQAVIIAAALADFHPGSVTEAFAKAPTSARSRIRKSMRSALALLADHPPATAELEAILATR
jgi:hypothetical protein